ncbi:MAG: hypothetical protein MR902_01235 [Campylobacter sp.]|nr:hypothetical protein [Campylobacter sp.]
MNILIIESEIYLAQSISSKLIALGYECEISTPKDALKQSNIDIVLLSTSINHDILYKIIDKFKNSIIILMVSYVSNDTVLDPIKAGASEYMQKPFMMEELIRKIKHFENYKKLISQNESHKNYIKEYFDIDSNKKYEFVKPMFPLLIKAINIADADSYVFQMCWKFDLSFDFIRINDEFSVLEFLQTMQENSTKVYYLSNIAELKGSDKDKIYENAFDKKIIVATTNLSENGKFRILELAKISKGFSLNSEILSIDEYVKQVIQIHQNVLPDTEIASKLGMSRKSLWEKRKKYGIYKKK